MEKIKILEAVAREFGINAEQVVRYLYQEKLLDNVFLQKLLENTHSFEMNNCSFENLEDNVIVKLFWDTRIGKLRAESSNLEVGMFYYAQDQIFAIKKIPGKKESGVLSYFDPNRSCGLITVLHQKKLEWSSNRLVLNVPTFSFERIGEGMGKMMTQLILRKAQISRKSAEAAEYCADYHLDGICAGQAFLADRHETLAWCKCSLTINESLRQIEGADLLQNGYYFSSTECLPNGVYVVNLANDKVETRPKHLESFVRPSLEFVVV